MWKNLNDVNTKISTNLCVYSFYNLEKLRNSEKNLGSSCYILI